MFIYLLRHGIAEDGGHGLRDAERALTDEGWKKLRKSSEAWRQIVEPPQVVFSSPLRRAQETASVLVEALGNEPDLRVDDALVPSAPAAAALSLLEAEQHSGTGSVAVVGHEPHLGYLLGLLLTGHPRLAIPLKKGMLVAVETESEASLIAGLRFALTQRAAAALG